MVKAFPIYLLCCALPLAASAQPDDQASTTAGVNQDWNWTIPRTEHGHPDLQGTWFFGSRTPLQRPANLGPQQTYGAAEVAELEARFRTRLEAQDAPLEADREAPEAGARIGQEADDAFLGHYLEPKLISVLGEYRTSVITDPVDGRIPRQEGFQDYNAKRRASGLGDTDGPEGQPLSGRCLIFGAAAPSLTPMMMNPNLMIVQNEDYVMVLTEMIHDARIIRLNDSHFDHNIPQWMGDPVGHWEGDTLVVNSRNFRPEQSSGRMLPLSEDFALEEHYTIVGDNEILYGFTVTDEQAYTQSFSGERILTRNAPEEQVYEFGCHEGNYSLTGILAGARRQEVTQDMQPSAE